MLPIPRHKIAPQRALRVEADDAAPRRQLGKGGGAITTHGAAGEDDGLKAFEKPGVAQGDQRRVQILAAIPVRRARDHALRLHQRDSGPDGVWGARLDEEEVTGLDWDEMQELVAGVLRAMGYRTQVSPPGADRGRDILASPDGFGFQQPRIVVEVKHRAGRMGSAEVRRFLGGRHRDDRGLFVSTGGFTREAHYEADRAQVPLALWTLDELTRTLLDNYPGTDTETKRLMPLRMFYVPA